MAYILRIDKPGTHGWQVRGPGRRKYPSRFFSDSRHGGHAAAFAAAEKHKLEMQQQFPPRPTSVWHDQPTGRNRSGVNGVYYSHNTNKKTKEPQYYWAAYCPKAPYKGYIKRFYITQERDEEEAFRLAVEFRKMWEEAATEGDQAIKRFFELVEDKVL